MAQEIKKAEPNLLSSQRYAGPFSATRAELDSVCDSFFG